MLIGVNALSLQYQSGGTRITFDALLRALLAVDATHTYRIFTTKAELTFVGKIAAAAPPRIEVVEVVAEQDVLPRTEDLNLYFSPLNHLHPRVLHIPTVSILHDVQERFYPEYFDRAELLFRTEEYPEILHASTMVVTISEFSKHSFVQHFRADPGKIEVVRLAPQAGLIAPDPGTWTRGALPAHYLFYPANWYKHKNHQLLLDAMPRLMKDWPGLHLVFTGTPRPNAYRVDEEIVRRGLAGRVHVFGDLSTAELRYLYKHSTAVVIPTLFEGFGIPAIEALALGCELICSDLPVLREVAGEAPLYFGVNDVEGLVRRVREVMTGSRHGRDARATVDLRRFSWEAAASRLLEVFREAHRRFWEKPAGGAKVGVIRGDADEVAEFDLVVEVGEGCRLLPGALEAAAVAWQREPGKRAYLGEAYETVGGKRREVAYLRFTGDGLYRFEGGAYPAMVFRRPGDRKALEAVYSERRDSEVCLLRRTVAECERTGGGGAPYRRVDTNEVVRVSPLRRWEGAAKRLSMRLPVRAQHVGRRVWFALTRRSG